MKKITAALALLTIFLNTNFIYAASNYSYTEAADTYSHTNQLQGSVTYIPQGTVTSIVLDNALNSETATVGSYVGATLERDFIYNGTIIAPKGSSVVGSITKARRAGMGNRNAQIEVVFNQINTPWGQTIPIRAVIKTNDNSGVLKGGTAADAAKDYTKKAVVGAGLGAALGTAMGAMSGGSVGRGAIYGTALGGGLGVAQEAFTKGGSIMIPQGACFDIYLTQPATITNQTYGY